MRPRPSDSGEDNQSFLVSVSDLMASLIFIFIITLMVFAFRFDSAAATLESAGSTRAIMLQELGKRLETAGLTVEIDTAQGILRLTQNSINFAIGDDSPLHHHRPRVAILAHALATVLPCFVPKSRATCIQNGTIRLDTLRYAGFLEAVLIEGHTDARPILNGRFRSNLELSGARSGRILEMMVSTEVALDELLNGSGRKVLSISGYGERRPVIPTDLLNEANRRIDLRFLMEPPSSPASQPPVVLESERALGER